MRISDWSSDVCSSDLEGLRPLLRGTAGLRGRPRSPCNLSSSGTRDRGMSALLEVRDLTVRFRSKTALRALVERDRHPWIEAVCDVSISIGAGEPMARVGESGPVQTNPARALIGLVGQAAGSIRFFWGRIDRQRR